MASLEPLTIDTELCEFTVPVAFQRVPASSWVRFG